MKKSLIVQILFIFIVFYGCSIINKTINKNDYDKYRMALNYLQKDSIAIEYLINQGEKINGAPIEIFVAPVIYPPVLSSFEYLANKKKMDLKLFGKTYNWSELISDTLYPFDRKLHHDPISNHCLNSLSTLDSAKATIVFSKVYDDFLTVSFVYDEKKERHINLLLYNRESIRYLFIFEDGKIKNVLYTNVIP